MKQKQEKVQQDDEGNLITLSGDVRGQETATKAAKMADDIDRLLAKEEKAARQAQRNPRPSGYCSC